MAGILSANHIAQRDAGLLARYFAGPTWSGVPVRTAVDATVSTGIITMRVDEPIEAFSADWTGYVFARRPGSYSFATISDDGSKVEIDGQVVVDNDGTHPATAERSTVWLARGPHRISVRYFQSGDQFRMDFLSAFGDEPLAPVGRELLSTKPPSRFRVRFAQPLHVVLAVAMTTLLSIGVALAIWWGFQAGLRFLDRRGVFAKPYALRISRSSLVIALVVGGAIRLAALALPGTADVWAFRSWAFRGSTRAPARLYSVSDVLRARAISGAGDKYAPAFYADREPANYPPVAVYELAGVGRLYRMANLGEFPDTAALTAAVKSLVVVNDAALLAVMLWGFYRWAGIEAAPAAMVAYWLNPGVILTGSMLGYLDPLWVLPAFGALAAAGGGRPFLGGVLITVAILTKPQGIILTPAVMLALWAGLSWRQRLDGLVWFGAGAALASSVIVAPVVAAGEWSDFVWSMSRFAHHDMLSGNGCNLWWIVAYVLRVVYAVPDMGVWAAVTMHIPGLAISRVVELGYPNPRLIGTALTLAAAAWALWTARRSRSPYLWPAVGAFLIHAYAILAAQVHENHLYAAVPLLVIVASGRSHYRPFLWALSAIYALNLNLFYGISHFPHAERLMIPRSITVIDATVVLAVANCVALAWHAGLLKRECSEPARADGPTVAEPAPVVA